MSAAATTATALKLRLRSISEIAHVGSLRQADKSRFSYEGAGLSVSRDPEEWTRIARLGGNPTWLLTRTDDQPGLFVEAHELTTAQRSAIEAWGVAQALVERVECWTVSYYDDELEDQVCFGYDSQEEAQLECEAMEIEAPVLSSRLAARPALAQRLRVSCDGDCFDLLLTVYAEDCLAECDGVWWEDSYGYMSAPRGVILPSRVAAWTARRESSEEAE